MLLKSIESISNRLLQMLLELSDFDYTDQRVFYTLL